jgi:GNAT superfamily N-acetyltransferase
VVDVLHESFFDYPVMRAILGDDGDYDSRLRQLVTFFTMARVLRREVMLGIPAAVGAAGPIDPASPARLDAAALVSYPDARESPPELAELRERTWKDLGDAARSRYEEFGAACAPFEVAAPHLHLNMIGVRRGAQGKGLARPLMEAVHRLSRDDASSTGVSLTTEVETNVALYEYFGYRVIGTAKTGAGFTTWGFFRSDSA